MLKIIDKNLRIDFISKYDKEEPKTIFVLRPLTGIEMPETLSNKADILKMVLLNIVEIKNSPDSMNVEQVVNSLDVPTLTELIMKCNSINRLTGEDEKNS